MHLQQRFLTTTIVFFFFLQTCYKEPVIVLALLTQYHKYNYLTTPQMSQNQHNINIEIYYQIHIILSIIIIKVPKYLNKSFNTFARRCPWYTFARRTSSPNSTPAGNSILNGGHSFCNFLLQPGHICFDKCNLLQLSPCLHISLKS